MLLSAAILIVSNFKYDLKHEKVTPPLFYTRGGGNI